jgi:hypothetical protein
MEFLMLNHFQNIPFRNSIYLVFDLFCWYCENRLTIIQKISMIAIKITAQIGLKNLVTKFQSHAYTIAFVQTLSEKIFSEREDDEGQSLHEHVPPILFLVVFEE